MFWRRKSTPKDKDYEKILADIDTEIKKIGENLRQIKIREDRSIVTWLYYSIPVYCAVLIGYSLILYQSPHPWPVLIIQASPLLIGLFLIIFIKRFISIWYKKKQMKEEEKRVELKKQQKEILEELKNKLKYYQTKNLIEKYEFQDESYGMNNGMPMHNGMPMNNGMPMMRPQMNMNNKKMNQNQMRNQQMLAHKQQLMEGHNLSKQRSMPVVLQNGKQQFVDMKNNQQYNQYPPQYGYQSPSNNERKWIDKLMDAIVGDVNEIDTKYALVCNFCYTHCGLALPEEYKTFKYICPKCNKLNDNAKKYNVENSNSKKVIDDGHLLLPPPSAPVEGPKSINTLQNDTFSKSAPVSPQKESSSISDKVNKKHPNLIRRSSTLLDEMDESTNTDTTTLNHNNQVPTNINHDDVINEGTDEALDQDINGINQFEQEIEKEKEVINYQESSNKNNNNNSSNDNDNNNSNTMVEDGENNINFEAEESIKREEIQNNKELIDESKQENLISSIEEDQNIIKESGQITEENL